MNILTTYVQEMKKQSFAIWATLLLLLFLVCHARTAEPIPISQKTETPSEYELKAIYLYNFLKFIKWPEDNCNLQDGRSHRIAVLGDSPFNHVLLALQKELRDKDKDLEITFYGPYRENMEFSCCCLLFINHSEHGNLDQILGKLSGMPVLTVADTETFVDKGVMITLISRDNKIRWAINRLPVNESGIQLSARLLDIAVQVIDAPY